ncbi:low molecular weight protein-tyrosine-phosphatase [uncultured Cocleimonas sp.]|uniref:low molecular weight protein-tyrosine-phosphatase n=1 Tax=uncultured Cocleimonas sp. TaxID=1051587 RepID=UPI003457533C
MFNNVMMVCIGNICRSPMAEAILQHNIPELKVYSSGLGALSGKPADPSTMKILSEINIDFDHVAQQINSVLVKNADIILTMEDKHVQSIISQFPESRGKVHLIGKWQNNEQIPDPYKKDFEAFQESYRLINKGLEAWQEKLWN